MKTLLAITLLFGFASFTSAHAEWEILDPGSAVYAGSTTNAPVITATPSATEEAAKTNSSSK
jgi:hypothetical protein